jgi:hypothetical protein
MPAMELNRWELLVEDGYVVLGEGKDAIVRNKKTDKEIQVLRDKNSEIIYARQIDNGPLVPDSSEAGYPVEIQPFYGDAGKGTALVLRELMDRGYFSVKRKT